MKLRFKPFLTAALFALGVFSTPALSQDAGWYIGAGGGVSKFVNGCTGVVTGPGTTCDDRGTAWKVFGGYQFNANFGYELGYADLGELTQSAASSSTTIKTKVYEMALVATIPLNQEFSLYAKGGLFHWELDRTIVGTGAGTTSVSGRETTYGFGVKYNFTRNLALRMEWQRYTDVGDTGTTGKTDVAVALVGVSLKF